MPLENVLLLLEEHDPHGEYLETLAAFVESGEADETSLVLAAYHLVEKAPGDLLAAAALIGDTPVTSRRECADVIQTKAPDWYRANREELARSLGLDLA